ncbi:GntR family transcriptional regulator [Nitratireductor aquimarinus]|uniref:GntR family transcriptional regulator n=1 Tax=Alphaproteobacteria TaxID=28211 RepID=UPI0019D36539|nr:MULTISPECIES: GntR family transcriptional regulator [Alphaproteobacteria]MBN7758572.1 GntR family transcriptional regulator [Nitratireductor aquimarinus]MBY6001334.1 GntR family transcriptional regulator [Tritonibacter mobilis]MBY6023366.1 GntR family transcriptional regulator [Nitratireductor sp. DP7N14-4]MCV0381448.1 GntR family transcriptional regulator [Nitratireductor sp.]
MNGAWVIEGPLPRERMMPSGQTAPSWLRKLEERVIAGDDFWQIAGALRQGEAQQADTEKGGAQAVPFVELVYEMLRIAIRTGALSTGTPLIEAEIGEALAVSRTPVREAMQRLSADGLLSRRKRGWEVRKLDLVQIRESYEVRMALEGFATAQAAIRASDEEIASIVASTRARSELGFEDISDRLTSNRELHGLIFAASGNERLVDSIRKNMQYYFAHRFAQFVSREEAALFQKQHELIADAIAARDPREAELLARQHVKSTYLAFEKFYKLL